MSKFIDYTFFIFFIFGFASLFFIALSGYMSQIHYSNRCDILYGNEYIFNENLKHPACIKKEYNYTEDSYKTIDVKLLEVVQ